LANQHSSSSSNLPPLLAIYLAVGCSGSKISSSNRALLRNHNRLLARSAISLARSLQEQQALVSLVGWVRLQTLLSQPERLGRLDNQRWVSSLNRMGALGCLDNRTNHCFLARAHNHNNNLATHSLGPQTSRICSP